MLCELETRLAQLVLEIIQLQNDFMAAHKRAWFAFFCALAQHKSNWTSLNT